MIAAGTSSGWKLWCLFEIEVGGATCEVMGGVASAKVAGFYVDVFDRTVDQQTIAILISYLYWMTSDVICLTHNQSSSCS